MSNNEELKYVAVTDSCLAGPSRGWLHGSHGDSGSYRSRYLSIPGDLVSFISEDIQMIFT